MVLHNDGDECDSDTDTLIGDPPTLYTPASSRDLLYQAIEEHDILQVSYYLSLEGHLQPSTDDKPPLLWFAIRKSTAEIVDVLIRGGCSIFERERPSNHFKSIEDYKYNSGSEIITDESRYTFCAKMTLLHWAVISRSYHKVRALLAHGASPNWVDNRGKSVLQYAVETGVVHIAEELIKQGANSNQTVRGYPANKIIHVAVHFSNFSMVKMLLKYGADPRVMNLNDQTLLHVLVENERLENPRLVELLIDAGCPVDHRQHDSYTPLYLAVQLKLVQTSRVLLENNADPNTLTRLKWSFPLLPAVRHRSHLLIHLLLEFGAKIDQKIESSGETVLHDACKAGNEDIVELLIKAGADVNATDADGRTPLHVSVVPEVVSEHCKDIMLPPAKKNRDAIVRLLLNNGAVVEQRLPQNQCTALLLAAEANRYDTVQLLLEYKADVHALARHQRSALHLLSLAHEDWGDCLPLAEKLVEAGVSASKKDTWSYTPLHNACRRNKMSLAQLFLKHGADINDRTNAGDTALHLAVKYGSTTLVKFLLQNGAALELKEWHNETPIFAACGYHHAIKIKLLLDYGARLNIKCDARLTPFCKLVYDKVHANIVMMKHLALVYVSGKPVEECDLLRIGRNEFTQAFFVTAVDQAFKLKCDKFFGNTTFADVMDSRESALFLLVKNENFVKAFQKSVGNHPFYESDLKYKFDKAVKRKETLYAMEALLNSVLGHYLPSAVIERLATFVIVDDLQKMDLCDHIASIEKSLREYPSS